MINDRMIFEWEITWKNMGVKIRDTDLAWLVDGYSGPGRYYHTIQHVLDCITNLNEFVMYSKDVTITVREQAILKAALWFHDCVYDIMAPSAFNEKASADIAEEYILKRTVERHAVRDVVRSSKLVKELILVSTHHSYDEIVERDSKLFYLMNDLDLLILGSDQTTYSLYAENIFNECQGRVSKEVFNSNRKRVLEFFLQRPKIYFTDYFADRYESIARKNMVSEIQTLSL